MSTSEIRTILNKFLASAKKETGKNPTYKDLYSHVKEYSKCVIIKKSDESDQSMKKYSRKNTTEPGDIFDGSICHCRVWNRGYAKQCSNRIKEDDVCGTHLNSIQKYGGWTLGKYCDKQPTKHLFKHASGKKGDPLPWKDIKTQKRSSNTSSSSNKSVDPYVMKLKDKYEEEFGKRPRGPKASNIEWLREKLNITSSDEDSDSDSESDEDITNSFKNDCVSNSDDDDDAEEQQKKEKEEQQKKEKEDDSDKEEEPEEKEDDLPDGVKKIKYEGIIYYKSIEKDEDSDKYEISNEDDIVGYMDDDDIIEFEDGYDEIHQDHEDYNP